MTDFRNPILDNSIADAPSIGLDPPLKSCHDITLLIWDAFEVLADYEEKTVQQILAGLLYSIHRWHCLSSSDIDILLHDTFNISIILIYFYMILNISITPLLAQLVTLCLQQGVINIQIFKYI